MVKNERNYYALCNHFFQKEVAALNSHFKTAAWSLNMQFDEPPVGKNGRLTIPQLRWALREQIRIDTLKAMALNSMGADGVNQMVSNYNRRVGSSQYKQTEMKQAEKDISSIRGEIITQVKNMAQTNHWINNLPAVMVPTANGVSGVPADTVRGPAFTFRTYHSLISTHQLGEAYQLFSSNFQNAVEYSGWALGYSRTISSIPQDVTIFSNSGNRAVLSFQLMAKDRTSNGVSIQFFAGKCILIKENGEWKIDEITANKI